MSVAKYVRGLDLRDQSLHVGVALGGVEGMAALEWLRLDRTQLDALPAALFALAKLRRLEISYNGVNAIATEIARLPALERLRANGNAIADIPDSFFRNTHLHTLLLAHNKLKLVPEGVYLTKELRTLSLADNGLSEFPPDLCRRLGHLVNLDLGHNQITALPPQFRRLDSLVVLNLAHNPLENWTLYSVFALPNLGTLNLSATQRHLGHFPPEIAQLRRTLTDLDLSLNKLDHVPVPIYDLEQLVRLNLSFNDLEPTDIAPSASDRWRHLETLNLSGNRFDYIPTVVCHFHELRRLYLNKNRLRTQGIPAAILRLSCLRTLALANNVLESVPRAVCLLPLKVLNLADNQLTTLPVEIHLVLDSGKVNLNGNPFLKLPPRPQQHVSAKEFYGVDLSLEASEKYHARMLKEEETANEAAKKRAEATHYDADAKQAQDDQADTVLSALAAQAGTLAGDGGHAPSRIMASGPAYVPPPPKRWTESLVRRVPERPKLDYSTFFDADLGKFPALEVFIIENLNPRVVPLGKQGVFCSGDAYLILNTTEDDSGQLRHRIYFWIGNEAAIDKRACAAIHAVNLRHHIGTAERDRRVTQGEEPKEFLQLFPKYHVVDPTEALESGLNRVEFVDHATRLFVLVFDGVRAKLDQIEPRRSNLNSKNVYVLESKEELFVYVGQNATVQARAKASLLAEAIYNNDYKTRATLTHLHEGDVKNKGLARFNAILEEQEQELERTIERNLKLLKERRQPVTAGGAAAARPVASDAPDGGDAAPTSTATDATDASGNDDLIEQLRMLNDAMPKARHNTLYRVDVVDGYLELPQVRGRLSREMLDHRRCFILDCHVQIFIWIGRESPPDDRIAARKLVGHVYQLVPRPAWAKVSRVLDRTETEQFKRFFDDWAVMIRTDYGRRVGEVTPEAMVATAVKMDADVRAIYKPEPAVIPNAVALKFIRQSNEQLEGINCFFYNGKRFIAIQPEEKGIFSSCEVYAFLCKYYPTATDDEEEEEEEDDEDEDEEEDDDDDEADEENKDGAAAAKRKQSQSPPKAAAKAAAPTKASSAEKKKATRKKYKHRTKRALFECVLYYWEGRNASSMGWLNFKFQFQKTMEALVKQTYHSQLKVVRTSQQKEPLRLLAHFNSSIVIHRGFRSEAAARSSQLAMYHVRAGATIIGFRAIEITPTPNALVSRDCFFVRDPVSGVLYLWVGRGVSPELEAMATSLAPALSRSREARTYVLQTINDGAEPTAFWLLLGGRATPELGLGRDRLPLRPRLFRCSNLSGAFKVTEVLDYCQDDLAMDDVMLLDPGPSSSVYLWIGPEASTAEQILSRRTAEVYLEQRKDGRSGSPTSIIVVQAGKEPQGFMAHFHGWSDEPKREEPKNEFLRTETLITGRVLD